MVEPADGLGIAVEDRPEKRTTNKCYSVEKVDLNSSFINRLEVICEPQICTVGVAHCDGKRHGAE